MAVLPGAVVGDLLERLNAERRRVVLDGFEPHAGEWSSRWSGRATAGGAAREHAQAEADVLEKIALDLTADEPGQPTAAEIVIQLTMAIRRDPDQAAIIVDAMLTDHPRMAVVIVATALRVCPGLRKEILAQARRHKPFARHPFILGLLLAFVAKILGDNAAEAAESFAGVETPSEILAAMGRHLAAPRSGADSDRGGRDSRAIGFGPIVAAPFVATVLAAGDALSRGLAPETASPKADAGPVAPARRTGDEDDMRPSTDAAAAAVAGDDGGDGLRRAVQPGDADAAAVIEGAEVAPPPEFRDAATLEPPAVAPRAMMATLPAGAGETAPLPPQAPPVDAAVADETELAAALFERVLNELVLRGDDAVDADTILVTLTDQLAAALAIDAEAAGGLTDGGATADAGFLADGEGTLAGVADGAFPDAPTVVLSPSDPETGVAFDPPAVPAVVVDVDAAGSVTVSASVGGAMSGEPGPAEVGADVDLVVGDAAVGVSADTVLLGDGGIADAVAGISAGIGAATIGTLVEVALIAPDGAVVAAIEAEVGLGPVATEAAANIVILGPAAALETILDASVAIGEGVLADTSLVAALLGDAGVASIATTTAIEIGEGIAAEVAVSAGLLDGGAALDVDLAATAGIGSADIAAAADLGLLGPGGVATADLDLAAEIAALSAATAAELELFGDDGAVAAEASAALVVAPEVEVAADAAIVVGDGGIAAELDVAASVGEADVGVAAGLSADPGAAAVGTAVALAVAEEPPVEVAAALVVAEEDTVAAVDLAAVVLPDVPPAEASVVVTAGDEPAVTATAGLDDLLSVDIELTGGGVELDVDLLPEAPPVAVVEDVADAVETLLGALYDEPEPEPPPPPPVATPPPQPVQSILYSLGGLFG